MPAGSTGFAFLGAPPPPTVVVDPPPVDPPPTGLKLTRWGFTAGFGGKGDGPTWVDTKGPLTTSAGLAGHIKVKRLYTQYSSPTAETPGDPCDRFTTAYDDIIELAGMGGVVIVSGRWTTDAQFTQLRTDIQAFVALHPDMPFIIVTHHEPKTNAAFPNPGPWVVCQMKLQTATAGIPNAVPAVIYNGYFWSGGASNRVSMLSSGGFPAWAPAAMLNGLNAQNGYMGMDAYPGSSMARPGNVPPSPEKPGEGAGVRIRNFGEFCAGRPFTDNKGIVAGSTVVVPKLLCGEIGSFLEGDMLDAMAAASEVLDVASWWNHRVDGAGLENVSPPVANGNGGNPNSAKWKAEYLRQEMRVAAAGGPRNITLPG